MNKEQLIKELNFKAIRSSGAGGQHVNKVSSKIELTFSLENSLGLTPEEKERVYLNLGTRLTKDGRLILFSDESRSQHKNKELAIKRFLALIQKNTTKQKVRKASKPTRASILKKRENKQRQGFKKSMRKKITL